MKATTKTGLPERLNGLVLKTRVSYYRKDKFPLCQRCFKLASLILSHITMPFLSCHLLVGTQFYPFEFTQLATSEGGLLYESDGACGSRLK
jgi:hypothetical protein